MQLIIDNELEEFIKPLHADEFEALTLSIRAIGCIEPITVWSQGKGSAGTIVDGHHRYAICQQYNIPFKTIKIKFADKLAVMTWMFDKQKGRRNLSIVERLELHAKLREYASKYAKERQLAGKVAEDTNDNNLASRDAKVRKKGKTLSKIAQEAGVSTRTAERYDTIQRKGTEEQKEALRSGQKKIGTVYKEIQAKEKPVEKSQSNECDIEKLLKDKTINTSYLLIYFKRNKETGKEEQAEQFNCPPNVRLKMCADSFVNSASSISAKDSVNLVKLTMGSVIQESEKATIEACNE